MQDEDPLQPGPFDAYAHQCARFGVVAKEMDAPAGDAPVAPRAPGAIRADAGVFCRFTLSGRFDSQFGAEAFNVPNHPQRNNPAANVTGANFGMITSAKAAERQLRFELRLGF
ncbi:MAG: hypothetical protein IPJ98_30985 [Bryobacterales bacterium]|nr:hypothetical protein [Bryobacterales bacterium]